MIRFLFLFKILWLIRLVNKNSFLANLLLRFCCLICIPTWSFYLNDGRMYFVHGIASHMYIIFNKFSYVTNDIEKKIKLIYLQNGTERINHDTKTHLYSPTFLALSNIIGKICLMFYPIFFFLLIFIFYQ